MTIQRFFNIARSDARWLVIVVVAWLFLSALFLWPAGYFLSVNRIFVFDTSAGKSPTMLIERRVHRSFYARYFVSVRRMHDDGESSVYCATSNVAHYEPDALLPRGAGLNLDYWTFPARCHLIAGKYFVVSTWHIKPDFLPQKTVQIRSNVFKVLPD